MDIQNKFLEKKKNFWISLTGYRTLIILKSLLEGDKTKNELIDILADNKITNKSISKDTLRITLNTLKISGCDISRPSKSNNFKYHLNFHPFCWNISDKEFNLLIKLRDKLSESLTYQEVIHLNSLFEKLMSLANNSVFSARVKGTSYLKDINKSILTIIATPGIIGKKIKIVYDSPKNGLEEIDLIPKKISFENGKLYLHCYSLKYSANSILNIERIKEVVNIDASKNYEIENNYEVIYKVFNDAFKTFIPGSYEKIIEKNSDSYLVSANVSNEFFFIQRLLLLGNNFKIISPDYFKEKLINKLKQIKKEYTDGEE